MFLLLGEITLNPNSLIKLITFGVRKLCFRVQAELAHFRFRHFLELLSIGAVREPPLPCLTSALLFVIIDHI